MMLSEYKGLIINNYGIDRIVFSNINDTGESCEYKYKDSVGYPYFSKGYLKLLIILNF